MRASLRPDAAKPIWLAAAAALVLGGCSSAPTEGEARRAYEAQLAQKVRTLPFTVTSFSKTNGQETDILGMKMYRFFYTAEVVFPDGYNERCLIFTDPKYCGGVPIPPGSVTQTFSGEIDFQKTERGWVAG